MDNIKRYQPGPVPSPGVGRRGHTVPRTGRGVVAAVLLAALLVPAAGCTASSGPSLPQGAYGTWDCSYFEPFTIVVGEGTFEWITADWSARGTWQLDRGRAVIDDRVMVEGVPDTVEGTFMLQMLVTNDQVWAVDVVATEHGRRVELHFPDGRVTCTKQE